MINNTYTFDQAVFLLLLGFLFGTVAMMLFFRLTVAPRLRAIESIFDRNPIGP